MQLNKVSVDDINVKGKKVLVRCDFNVPLKDGVITNDNRITAALPTIKKLIADGGKVILCSHLGKPKNGPEEKFSLAPVAVRLSELLGQDVVFANDDEVVGENAKKAVAEMKDGDVVLLQNTRFRKEETKNLEPFSSELASLADVFVMDAFGSAHRAHCSTVGVTDHIKDTAVGYLMQKEIDYLGNAVETPVRPFVAILGGAKVSDKIGVIENLIDKCDTIIIGGGMAYTFSKAQGGEIGTSLCEEDKIELALGLLKKAADKGVKLLLPVDTVCADHFGADAAPVVYEAGKIPADMMGLDIGTKTAELYAEAVKSGEVSESFYNYAHFTIFDNPTISEKRLGEIIAQYDKSTIWYRRDILGERCAAEGLIYRSFADSPDEYMTDADEVGGLDFINIGVDFGGNRSKTTYVAVGFSRCAEGYSLTVLDECVIDGGKGDIDPTKIEREMGEFLMKLREKYPGVSVRYIFADCEAQYLINGLRKHLKRLGETAVVSDCAKKPILDRISFVNRLIIRKRLKIVKTCTHLRDGLCTALWGENDRRLDNFTSDIDILDAFEYAIERYMQA